MALCTATFEAGTNGNTISSGDAGSATAWDAVSLPAGTLAYDTTHTYGTLAAKLVTAQPSQSTLIWNTALGTVTDYYGRIYLWFDSWPTAGGLKLVAGLSGASAAYQLIVNTSGTLSPNDSAGSWMGVQTSAIATGQWIRAEWHIIHSTTVGQCQIKLFNSPDSGTPTSTVTSSAGYNTRASSDSISIGNFGGNAATTTAWLDNIVVGATSYPGPAVASSFIPQAVVI